MIDDMIQFLELVVAMEEIGKLDTDSDGLEFGEIFEELSEGFW
jgi:hypothetical protein